MLTTKNITELKRKAQNTISHHQAGVLYFIKVSKDFHTSHIKKAKGKGSV